MSRLSCNKISDCSQELFRNDRHKNLSESNSEDSSFSDADDFEDSQTDEAVAQNAIDATGFGKFNWKISILGALIFMNSAISITSASFIIPAAVCDFQLKTIDKGRIAIAPLLGTCFGCLIWGFVADMKGRKKALIMTLFIQGISEAIASIVRNYWVFLFFKFLSGVAVAGQVALLFTYIGEFQPKKFRKRILSWMEAAWIVGLLILPNLAWIILPLEFAYESEYFFFRSWNLFILVCCLPAELIAIALFFFPETPKYLAETGQNVKLLKVLGRMYEENTGLSSQKYFDMLMNSEDAALAKLVAQWQNKSLEAEKMTRRSKKFMDIVKSFRKQAKTLVKSAAYLKSISVACIIGFLELSSYYSLLLWLPEIFERFAKFEKHFPNETTSICSVSKQLISLNSTSEVDVPLEFCNRHIDPSVFTNSLWLGVACVPAAVIVPLFVDRMGFKFFLVFTNAVAFVVTLGLFLVKSSLQNLVLSCIFESMTSLAMSLMYCLLVVTFPTNCRMIAGTLLGLFGRVGSLVGNLMVTYLIDDYCDTLIIIVAVQLLVATILSFIVR
ncbi:synaptic vesicle glycoprotein 2B-like isoform X1 [Leptopilina heterotoma]|uniref:synaptic vesicle glycoprotein 2B-like isoform X1 n=1 Tax=Leptopilina heterotoma TaxID=63436 RepID=UPI001CA82E69|nr:synaptic vesicle glycoprotein 2B-like isoform X1 [Leptopilina heterotoma]